MSNVQPESAATAVEASDDAALTAHNAATTANAEQASQEQATGTTTEQPTEQGTDTPQGIDALPEWAQKEIRDLRKESGGYRTKAKEHEQTAQELAAAKDAERNELVQQIAKTLGIAGSDEEQDPAKLLEAAQAERDQTAQQLREYKQRDAIRTASDTAKITDPALLEAVLRSDNAFNQLDINADDYGTQVAARIAETIELHPALAQVAPTASGVDTSTTNAGNSPKLTREDLKTMSATDINKAAREGKLTHLMNN